MELVNVAFIAIFIFPIFLNYVVEAGSCPSHHSHTGTTDDQICLRFPGVGASYNDAVTNCQAKSGSLLNVEDIKFIDVNFAKSKAKLSIFRIDAKKDSNSVWRTSNGHSVDFSDFPSFDQSGGNIGGSLVWIPQANDRLFPVSSSFSSIKYINLFPLCSAANIVHTCVSNCCGNGNCNNGKCECDSGYRIEENCCCQDSSTTIKFIDDQNEPLKNFVVMYFITEGNTTNGIPEVALTDSLMGQIIISGCAGKTIMLVVDGFCLSIEIILTQPGTEIVSVMVTKETIATQHVFDAITGQAIFGAMVAGQFASDSIMSTTNEYGNLVTNNKCEGIMDTLTIGKIGYCDNSVTVDTMGDCVVQNVPLMPSADVKFFITDTIGHPIEDAVLEQNQFELNGTSDSNGKIILSNLCYGTKLNSFVISKAGFCDFTGSNYVINKIPHLLIPVVLKANSELHVTVKDNTDSSIISNSTITAKNIRTSEEDMQETDANGLVVFNDPNLLCEGSDLMVHLNGTINSGNCSGSYVFYRLEKGINEVDFFVSCT